MASRNQESVNLVELDAEWKRWQDAMDVRDTYTAERIESGLIPRILDAFPSLSRELHIARKVAVAAREHLEDVWHYDGPLSEALHEYEALKA